MRKWKIGLVLVLTWMLSIPVGAGDADKRIYLTFDDGPGLYTAQLLDILEQYDAKATFFVVNTGFHMDELLNRMTRQGHALGIHSYSHDFSGIYSSEKAFWQDFYQMQELLKEKTGQTTMLMRFPGGSSNTISRRSHGIMSRLTKQAVQAGFTYFDWNVDSGDGFGCRDVERIFQNVISGIQGKNMAVVLLHDLYPESVRAVERILRWGQRNGYRFLPLSADSPCCHHRVQN